MKKLILTLLLLPMLAYAEPNIDFPRVTINGKRDDSRRQFEQDYDSMMRDLEEQYRSAYNGRGQWTMIFNDDSGTVVTAGTDLRCNSAAKNAVNAAVANSATNGGNGWPAQKTSADNLVKAVREQIGNAAFNAMVNSWPRQTGRTAQPYDQAFNAPILSIIWSDGSQTNFTMVNNTGSAPGNPNGNWTVGAPINNTAKPSGDTVTCPA